MIRCGNASSKKCYLERREVGEVREGRKTKAKKGKEHGYKRTERVNIGDVAADVVEIEVSTVP